MDGRNGIPDGRDFDAAAGLQPFPLQLGESPQTFAGGGGVVHSVASWSAHRSSAWSRFVGWNLFFPARQPFWFALPIERKQTPSLFLQHVGAMKTPLTDVANGSQTH